MIRLQTTDALKHLDRFKPYKISPPITLEITFKKIISAEVLSYLPNVQRVDGATVRIVATDMIGVTKFLEFVGDYDSSQ